MDIKQGEKVEGELDVLIARRHDKRVAEEGERAELEAWGQSARVEEERDQAERRSRWIDYHQNLCRLHSALAAEHEEKAQKLMEGDAA